MPFNSDSAQQKASSEADHVASTADSSAPVAQWAQEAWSKGVSAVKEHPVLTAGVVIAGGLVIHNRNMIATSGKALVTDLLGGAEKEASSMGSNVLSQRFPGTKIVDIGGSSLENSLTQLAQPNASEEKIAMQLLRRRATNKAVDLSPEELMGTERFRTNVVAVAPHSWLGETYKNSLGQVGQMKAIDGSNFGSAAILKDNYVLTVNHVINRGTNRLPMQYGYPSKEFSPLRSNTMRMSQIVLEDGRTFSTELVAYNPESDLALLKIHSNSQLPGLDVADSLPTGRSRAAALGYPISREFEQAAISPGTYLPGLDPTMPNYTRFAMRTYGGHSGAPIISDGKLVGLVSNGNITQDVGITFSPRLDDINDLLTVAKARQAEGGVLKVLRSEKTGQLEITKEPSYNWWNSKSEAGTHDAGKNINPAVFEIPKIAPPQFLKGPLQLHKPERLNVGVGKTEEKSLLGLDDFQEQLAKKKLNMSDVIASENELNFINSGAEHNVYRIRGISEYVLRTHRSTVPPVFSAKSIEIAAVPDPLPLENFGQPIARIQNRLEVLKRVNGEPYGVLPGSIADEQLEAKLHYEGVRRISEFPQVAYDNLAKRLKTAANAGLKFDGMNPNNILLDAKNGALNPIDFKQTGHSLGVDVTDLLKPMVKRTPGLPRLGVDGIHESSDLHPLQAQYRSIIEKTFNAAEKAGISRPTFPGVDMISVFHDAGISKAESEALFTRLSTKDPFVWQWSNNTSFTEAEWASFTQW